MSFGGTGCYIECHIAHANAFPPLPPSLPPKNLGAGRNGALQRDHTTIFRAISQSPLPPEPHLQPALPYLLSVPAHILV